MAGNPVSMVDVLGLLPDGDIPWYGGTIGAVMDNSGYGVFDPSGVDDGTSGGYGNWYAVGEANFGEWYDLVTGFKDLKSQGFVGNLFDYKDGVNGAGFKTVGNKIFSNSQFSAQYDANKGFRTNIGFYTSVDGLVKSISVMGARFNIEGKLYAKQIDKVFEGLNWSGIGLAFGSVLRNAKELSKAQELIFCEMGLYGKMGYRNAKTLDFVSWKKPFSSYGKYLGHAGNLVTLAVTANDFNNLVTSNAPIKQWENGVHLVLDVASFHKVYGVPIALFSVWLFKFDEVSRKNFKEAGTPFEYYHVVPGLGPTPKINFNN